MLALAAARSRFGWRKRFVAQQRSTDHDSAQRKVRLPVPPPQSSTAGVRRASRLTTASRRKTRGLDTSLTPRPLSPPCGECAGVATGETSMPKAKTETAEVTVEADMRSPFRLRCMLGTDEYCSLISCPACRFTPVTRPTPPLFPHCARIPVFEPVRSQTAASLDESNTHQHDAGF